jgi:membrane AbrB-like protein
VIPSSSTVLGERPAWVQWALVAALGIPFTALLHGLRLPAGGLLGPMAAAIAVALSHGSIRVPDIGFKLAQGVIGCLVARSLSGPIVGDILRDWPLFLATVFGVLAASTAIGWVLARHKVLPGTTAIWGSFPGAAAAMCVMADAYGADIRLVSFMQYYRVVLVVAAASTISRLWVHATAVPPPTLWFPALDPHDFAATLGLALVVPLLADRLRIPSGAMLMPMILGVVLQDAGVLTITLPPWLLSLCYALVGCSIGLRFTRSIVGHAARALPRVTLAIVLLIAACAGLGVLLTRFAGIDPLTAYLATSPGGADSVAIISASSPVDMPFVMALQTARFVIILLVGPSLARLIANHASVPADAVRPR